MIRILLAQYGTVSDIEVVWTVIAFIGLIFSFNNLRSAYYDRKFLLKEKIKNGRWLLANATLKLESARATIQLIFLSIGILLMQVPDPPHLDLSFKETLIGVVVRWGIIISATLLTLKSYWTHQLRNSLRDSAEID